MRPRRLEVLGFTSYRDRQEVDFSELDLFVITGPTGAGKTSLLDAMALALYGQVPRIGARGLTELVTHGQAEGRITLEFSVEGDVYRVTRRLPRRGPGMAKLERQEGDGWVDATERGGVRAVNEAVQRLLKLDFDSFCKAVVLPQGEFARFLKGDQGERRETLVVLLGLDSYERMGIVARERERDLRVKTQRTVDILAGDQFADATAEGLAAAQAAAEQAVNRAKAVAGALAEARGADRQYAERERARAQAVSLQQRLEALSEDLSERQRACRDAEEAARAAQAVFDPARARTAAAEQALSSAEDELARLTEQLGTVEELIRLASAAESLPGCITEHESARLALKRTVVEEEATAARITAIQERMVGAEVELASRQRQHTAADDVLRATRDECLRAERQVEELGRLRAAVQQAEHELEPARRRADDAGRMATTASAQARALEQRVEDLRRRDLVGALVTGLAAGDPCPVCQRPLERDPSTDGHVSAELEAVRAACATARAEAERFGRAEAAAAADVQGLERNAAHAREELVALCGDNGDGEALEASLIRARAAVEEALTSRQAAGSAVEGAREVLDELRQSLAGERSRQEGLGEQRAQAQHALAAAQARLETARGRLQAYFGDEIPPDAAARVAAGRALIDGAAQTVRDAQFAERAARADLQAAERALAGAHRRLAEIDVTLESLRARAQSALEAAAAFIGNDVLAALPDPASARDARAGELADWSRQAMAAVAATVQRLAGEAASLAQQIVAAARSHSVQTTDVSTALTELERLSREALDARVRAQERAASVAAKLAYRQQLEAEIQDERAQAEVLKVIGSELRADRFIEFVIQETLDLLATRASEELRRISDGRYSLISAEGQFSVIDHVNADEQRSVKTLSGGETFMASLALALALSQHVSDLAGEGLGARLEAVFIDEGFGALDPETLDEVIDALERLRDADLLVGVISHVPEVAARIGEGLEVRSDGSRSVVLPRSADRAAVAQTA